MKAILKNRNMGLIMGILAMGIMAQIFTPKLYEVSTLMGMFRNNSIFIFLAIAEMIIIVSGNIDLSGPSVLAFSGCICTLIQLYIPGLPVVVIILIAIVAGVLCGLLNGYIVHYLKITPLIATLGTSYIIRGIAYYISHGNWFMPHQFNDNFINLTTGKIFGVYNILWISIILMILASVVLGHTTIGRRQYAIGSNSESSEIAGIKVKKVGLLGYAIAGGLCGFAGLMYVSNYAACHHSIASGYEMTAIVICMLGGVKITGGEGGTSGLYLAVLLMAVINSFISMLPGLSIWQDAIQGFIIIIAVLINIYFAYDEHRRGLKERGELL